ncbi:MAG TPA: carbohydrate kinase family protein [Candidatus Binatus sp.]|nr:carbohydrate kinase family protein [Candidatus Binatus sp.]
MRAPRFDILGIGENATDTVLQLSQFPALGSKVEMLGTQILLGGQVATALIACQRWGLRTHYVGVVGDDHAAELHRRELRRAGVHSDLAQVTRTLSQMSFILIDTSSGERTIVWRRDPRLTVPPAFLQRSWVTGARLLHIDGHDPATTSVAASWARASGIPVVADLDHMSPGLQRLLPFVDYPVTSKEFPLDATGEKNLLKALPQLQRKYGSRAVCATIGVDGALAWDGTRFWYAASYKVRVVDTTGAGDLFHAAFSYGILRRWDLQRILDFACAAAGLNCETLGARGGISSLSKVKGLQRDASRNRALYSQAELAHAAAQAPRRKQH